MSHNHTHSEKNIGFAFFLKLSFTFIELFGGYLTNSVAVISNALHDLEDAVSLGTAWILEKVAKKESTAHFSYGYKRFSLLAALINAVILLVGSVFLLAEAIPRLWTPEESHAQGMIFIAIIGMIVNLIAIKKVSKGKTLNEKIISWHLIGDFLSWIAVFIVSITIFFAEIRILDPILSIGITLYIFWGVGKNLKSTALLFLQATPDSLEIKTIEERLKEEALVEDVHNTHLWSLDGESHVLSSHIVVDCKTSQEKIMHLKRKLKEKLKKENIQYSTLEIEFNNENCKKFKE